MDMMEGKLTYQHWLCRMCGEELGLARRSHGWVRIQDFHGWSIYNNVPPVCVVCDDMSDEAMTLDGWKLCTK